MTETRTLERFTFCYERGNYSFKSVNKTKHSHDQLIFGVKNFLPVEAPKLFQLTKKYDSLDEMLKDNESKILELCPKNAGWRTANAYVVGENEKYDEVTALPIQFYHVYPDWRLDEFRDPPYGGWIESR